MSNLALSTFGERFGPVGSFATVDVPVQAIAAVFAVLTKYLTSSLSQETSRAILPQVFDACLDDWGLLQLLTYLLRLPVPFLSYLRKISSWKPRSSKGLSTRGGGGGTGALVYLLTRA